MRSAATSASRDSASRRGWSGRAGEPLHRMPEPLRVSTSMAGGLIEDEQSRVADQRHGEAERCDCPPERRSTRRFSRPRAWVISDDLVKRERGCIQAPPPSPAAHPPGHPASCRRPGASLRRWHAPSPIPGAEPKISIRPESGAARPRSIEDRGGLAGAVGAEQRDRLAMPDAETTLSTASTAPKRR